MRLIDADALQSLFNETTTSLMSMINQKDIEHFVRACLMTTEMIHDAPTIDAEPVKRGHWEVLKTAIGAEYTVCSECKTDFTFKTDKGTFARMDLRNAHYCPNCGARMEDNE